MRVTATAAVWVRFPVGMNNYIYVLKRNREAKKKESSDWGSNPQSSKLALTRCATASLCQLRYVITLFIYYSLFILI